MGQALGDEAGGALPSPTGGMDLHEGCKRTAYKFDILWTKVQMVMFVSHYEGKRLPKAKWPARQLLSIFLSGEDILLAESLFRCGNEGKKHFSVCPNDIPQLLAECLNFIFQCSCVL